MPSHASGQSLPDWVAWNCCEKMYDEGTPCTGAAQGDYGRCLAHLDPSELENAVKLAKTQGLDARGVTVTPLLLSVILALLDRTDQNLPVVPSAGFDRATFTGNAQFDGAIFTGNARFVRATFSGDARFTLATFTGPAFFDRATFSGDAKFAKAIFSGDARFTQATFSGSAEFDGADFAQRVAFGEAKFGGDVRFGGASFDQRVAFRGMTFSGVPGFGGISLSVSSEELTFRSLRAAKTLWRAPSFGRVGEVDLSEVSFTGLAVLTATEGDAGSRRPKLVSLEQTDTTGLTVAGLDLSDCRFLGAINLDRLRIDGKLVLDRPPGWWQARRQVLREEGALRGWPLGDPPSPLEVWELERGGLLGTPSALSLGERASRLQTVYRALRKGRENDKDEPGAADFYYGEMEMRRLAAGGWERVLLTLFWLVSGYALRASRSLVAFAVVMAVFAVLLYLWGFQSASAPDLGGAFVYSVESATVFFRGPGPEQLTEWGRVFQVCLRLLGPALLALTVLAVRGRVKR